MSRSPRLCQSTLQSFQCYRRLPAGLEKAEAYFAVDTTDDVGSVVVVGGVAAAVDVWR